MAVDTHDDPESADAASFDLTPREPSPVRTGRGRSIPLFAVLGVLVIVIGFLLVNTLGDATTFFYNVDEAVAKRDSIGDDQIRMQGNILEGTVEQSEFGVAFTLAYSGESVRVNHNGEVPDLFQPAIPVVVVGSFAGGEFESEQILVRHDETYDEANPERVEDANEDADRARTGARGTGEPDGDATTGTTPASP